MGYETRAWATGAEEASDHPQIRVLYYPPIARLGPYDLGTRSFRGRNHRRGLHACAFCSIQRPVSNQSASYQRISANTFPRRSAMSSGARKSLSASKVALTILCGLFDPRHLVKT